MAQAILADIFPPQQRGLAFAVYGITAVTAPTFGPTLGGWITDNNTWRWIFYINLPVGLPAMFLATRMVEDPPYLKRRNGAVMRVDYLGIALLALSIGTLQILLDKGQEDDWFGSHFIVTLACIAVVCLVSLVVREWRHKEPVIDVHLFKYFSFATANLMMFTLGVILFSGLVMMPPVSSDINGLYRTVFRDGSFRQRGFAADGNAPRRAAHHEDHCEVYLAFGWLTLAVAMYYSTVRLDLLMSFWSGHGAAGSAIGRAGFFVAPISLIAYLGLPAEKSNSVSGLVNFMRNIGSTVGTSMVTTLLAQFHQSALSYHTTDFDPAFQNQVAGLSRQLVHAGISAADGQTHAYGMIYQGKLAQTQTLAYIDTYMVLAVGAGMMFLLAFIVRKNDPRAGGEAAAG
jgi:DHA2 family multidrug resistance protein